MTEKRANARIRFLLLAFAAVFAVSLGRAAYVQVVEGGRYERMASRQHRETIEIPAGRGTIYDRTGEPLAIGEQATTVYADPRNVTAPKKAAVKAAEALGLDADELYPVIRDRSKQFVYVQRKADPVRAKALEELGVAGLGFYSEERRAYPQGRVAAHVLGYAGTDNRGLDGLEASLDRTLAGKPGYEIVVRDPAGQAIDVVTSRRERAGRNVVLTLDHQLQASAEQILSNATLRWRARGATAIVMDPRTGAILAMANAPTFDANAFSSAPAESRRNRAVTDLYEPGSTFKIVTVAAALEDNVVAPDTTFCFGTDAVCPCGNGGDADSGCDNAQATGGVELSLGGFAPNGAGGGSATYVGSGFPAMASPTAIVIRSPSRAVPAPVFGDGLRCVGASGLVRFGATAASGGTSTHVAGHGAGAGVFHYQLWYRNTPSTFCDPFAAFNLSNGLSVTWP